MYMYLNIEKAQNLKSICNKNRLPKGIVHMNKLDTPTLLY